METVNFDTFQFYPGIMAGVSWLGYTVPTPLQAQVIPLVMQGKDIIGLTETGTDKTAAFVLPILHRLWSGQRGCTRALIISPTPEIAERTCEVISRLGRRTGLQNLAIYGNSGLAQQNRDLHSGPDVVVGCPGRLLNHLWKGTLNLSNLEILVIDEADHMSGLGLLPDIFNILMCITNKRQTLLFSASMPDNLRRLSRQFLHDPVTVQIGPKSTTKTVRHAPHPEQQYIKTSLLKRVLSKTKNDSVLVFTRTRYSAENAAQRVAKAGYHVTPLQGILSQYQQETALGGLAAGSIKILVVTDTVSRGIDVSGIFRIINYEIPDITGNNTRRGGRTGKVDKDGDALTLVTSTSVVNIHALEQLLDAPLESLAF